MARPAVSPTAPFTQVFCRISDAEVRVLVIVQVTAAGVTGNQVGAALPVAVRGETRPGHR